MKISMSLIGQSGSLRKQNKTIAEHRVSLSVCSVVGHLSMLGKRGGH